MHFLTVCGPRSPWASQCSKPRSQHVYTHHTHLSLPLHEDWDTYPGELGRPLCLVCVSGPQGLVGLTNNSTHSPVVPTGVHWGPWPLADPQPRSMCLGRGSLMPCLLPKLNFSWSSPRTVSVLLAIFSDSPCMC